MSDLTSDAFADLYTQTITCGLSLAQSRTSQPHGTDFLSRSQLSVGAVQKAIRALINYDLIERRENREYQLVDALLAQWLTQRPPTWLSQHYPLALFQ